MISLTDRVFLLSIAEATDTAYGFTDNYYDTDARVSRNTAYVASGGHTGGYMYAVGEAAVWWLRSPGIFDYYSSVVINVGYLHDDGCYIDRDDVAVRPAFNLNLNSVLFTSAAAGGKAGDGALAKIADYGGSEWKLTLLDDARAFAVTETEVSAAAGGTAALTCTGAEVGTNEYISAILTDATGSAVYYGRLTQPDAADGTVTFTVPADLSVGSYTMKVFSEQYNGDYKTDFASAFDEVTLKVFPGNGKALQLAGSGEAANILGAQQSSVWFGNYKQNGDGKDPVKWRVLSNADGKLFLLSDQNLDVVRYNETYAGVTWETCTLRKWLNGYSGNPHGDSFIGSAFSDGETAAIAVTALTNAGYPEYELPGSNDTADQVFVLSIAEATTPAYGFTDDDNKTETRVSTNTAYVASGGHTDYGYMIAAGEADDWWLRSSARDSGDVSIIGGYGNIWYKGYFASSVNNTCVPVRPALNVELNKVLFTSAAAGGKAGDGALTRIADYNGSEWKLTLLDDTRAFAVTETEATAAADGTVTLTYTGAAVGTNEYISAILADGTGSAVYYGRLTQPDAADGTVTFTVPADLAPGTYTLKVFSEQYNGDYKTDYASAFSDVALTVISELDAAKAAAKAELENYFAAIDPADYRPAQQDELTAAVDAGKDAIDAATDIDAVAAALADAKAVIDAIKTDAQLTAEEAAAALAAAKTSAKEDLAAYKNADDYRDAQKTELAAAITAGNAAIDAAADIDAVNAALADAKAVIDAIKTDAQLTAEELAADKAAFEEYKEAVKTLADGMKLEGDSDACAALIEAAKEAVDAQTYDESKTLDENKEAVDDAAALTQLAAALAAQRAAEADDPQEAFEEYRATLLTLAQALRHNGDSEAVTALIDEAVAALTGFTYDEAKTLAENEDALSDMLTRFADSVRAQRKAERQEYLNHQPCSLCGQHHTGSLMENMIGVIHGLIWIMRSIVLIAA